MRITTGLNVRRHDLSFLLLPDVLQATSAGEPRTSYLAVVAVGFGITLAALASSLLIPRPTDAGVE